MENQLVEGIVREALPSLTFRVELRRGAGSNIQSISEDGHIVLAYLAGKMKLNRIRVVPGDRVYVELGPDGRRGRIMRRL